MIINLRGTSGSGKSTVVFAIIDYLRQSGAEYREGFITGRKKPIYYIFYPRSGKAKPLVILGHYETACGGCDTIVHGFDAVMKMVEFFHNKGMNVLYEGMMLNSEVNRHIDLAQRGLPLKVIVINTELQECIRRINERRRKRNPNVKGVNPQNTTNRFHQLLIGIKKLEKAGVESFSLSVEDSIEKIKVLLEI